MPGVRVLVLASRLVAGVSLSLVVGVDAGGKAGDAQVRAGLAGPVLLPPG